MESTFQYICNLSLIWMCRIWLGICSCTPNVISSSNSQLIVWGAFPGFPAWTKSWTKLPRHWCPLCAATPLDTKGNAGISCPPYMTSHPSGLMSLGNPPLITHKAECILVPPPSRNSLESTCPQKSVTAIYVLTPLPCIMQFAWEIILASWFLTHNMNKHGFSVEDQ